MPCNARLYAVQVCSAGLCLPAELLSLLPQAACLCAAAAQLFHLSFQAAALLLSFGQAGTSPCQLALQLGLSRLPLLQGPAHILLPSAHEAKMQGLKAAKRMLTDCCDVQVSTQVRYSAARCRHVDTASGSLQNGAQLSTCTAQPCWLYKQLYLSAAACKLASACCCSLPEASASCRDRSAAAASRSELKAVCSSSTSASRASACCVSCLHCSFAAPSLHDGM